MVIVLASAPFPFLTGFPGDVATLPSAVKVRQAGFHGCLDSETMFSQFFGKLREMKLLPERMREGS